jgi:hypothetical protein
MPILSRLSQTVSEIGGTPESWHEFPSPCPSPKGRGNVESVDSWCHLPLGEGWGEGGEGLAAPGWWHDLDSISDSETISSGLPNINDCTENLWLSPYCSIASCLPKPPNSFLTGGSLVLYRLCGGRVASKFKSYHHLRSGKDGKSYVSSGLLTRE